MDSRRHLASDVESEEHASERRRGDLRERQRLSCNDHDGLNHSCSSIKIKIKLRDTQIHLKKPIFPKLPIRQSSPRRQNSPGELGVPKRGKGMFPTEKRTLYELHLVRSESLLIPLLSPFSSAPLRELRESPSSSTPVLHSSYSLLSTLRSTFVVSYDVRYRSSPSRLFRMSLLYSGIVLVLMRDMCRLYRLVLVRLLIRIRLKRIIGDSSSLCREAMLYTTYGQKFNPSLHHLLLLPTTLSLRTTKASKMAKTSITKKTTMTTMTGMMLTKTKKKTPS